MLRQWCVQPVPVPGLDSEVDRVLQLGYLKRDKPVECLRTKQTMASEPDQNEDGLVERICSLSPKAGPEKGDPTKKTPKMNF